MTETAKEWWEMAHLRRERNWAESDELACAVALAVRRIGRDVVDNPASYRPASAGWEADAVYGLCILAQQIIEPSDST